MWHSESHGRLKKLIDDIIKENDWIVEGSPRKVFKESFDCCDNVIVLDEYTIIRLVRVFKRWIRQRRGRESYNSRPTWDFLWLNIKWVFEFNRMKKGLLQILLEIREKFFTSAYSSVYSTHRFHDSFDACFSRSLVNILIKDIFDSFPAHV